MQRIAPPLPPASAQTFLAILSLLLFAASPALAAGDITVSSPDGNVVFTLLQKDSQLHYSISFRGRAVIEPSPLAFSVDGVSFTSVDARLLFSDTR